MLDRTRSGFGNGGGDMNRAMAGQHDTVNPGAIAATQQRAEIAGVGDAVDGDQERRPTTGPRAT